MNVGFRPFSPADGLTIKQSMPFNFSQDVKGLVAFNKDTFETLAVLVAQDWTMTTAQVHQVILNPMVIRHGWFQEIAEYLFVHAGRWFLMAPVLSNNQKAIRLNEKLGFKQMITLENAFDIDVDIVLMKLMPEDVNPKYWEPSIDLAEVA